VRRYPAYDPPEYLTWKAEPDELRRFEVRLREFPDRSAIIDSLDAEALLDLYRGLVRFRLHDIMLQRWVKQGVISKAWLGTGEEAVTIGAVHALRRGDAATTDVCAPMIRNAGACHEMGMSLESMLSGYLGTIDGPAKGRDLHIGSPSCGVVAPVSVVGGVCGVINGYALAFRLGGSDRVGMTWIGDGSTKSGEVHEALNFAAVNRLPVVFVLQNNQVALGTPLGKHHRTAGFGDWGKAYGVPLLEVDGNNVLDMYAAALIAVRRCRRGEGPVFISAETFRMGGHATHDVREARKLVSASLYESWGRRDPIGLYEEYLASRTSDLSGGNSEASPVSPDDAEARNRLALAEVEREVSAEVEEAARLALERRAREQQGNPGPEQGGVYA
jgi:TPP-dependent pyruvate/acetoin dehydrogenase alpha subunit